MAAYVACNAKYYKRSNWKGLSGHVHRQFENDENVRPELSHENFGRQFADLPTLEQRMMEAKQAAGLRARGFQADANVVLDNVLILSAERVEALKSANPDGYKADILAAAVALSERVRDEYGLEPMGIQFHWDEGHDNKDGHFVHNYHAHMQFFNFDFKQLNQPLRRMKRDDFSKIQDLAGECFSSLGFERGVSKKASKNKHLEKSKFLGAQAEKQILEKKQEIQKLNQVSSERGEEAWKLFEREFELKKSVQTLSSEQKRLEVHIDTLKSKIIPIARMGRMLETHRNDFEAFLASTPSDGIADRLKRAENRLRELGEDFKTPVDEYLQDFDNNPALKKF